MSTYQGPFFFKGIDKKNSIFGAFVLLLINRYWSIVCFVGPCSLWPSGIRVATSDGDMFRENILWTLTRNIGPKESLCTQKINPN
jgi:hypothetical protein